MALRNIADLRHSLAPGHRAMGLDVGEKTIGLALSDVRLTIASPLQTIRRGKFAADAAALVRLIAEHDVAALVIGLPINMDGTEGPRCQSVRAFAAELGKRVDVDVAFWDERLSTAAVTRTLLEADVSRARRRELVDKMAAAYILQGALDFLAMQSPIR
jgi:putative Holliday junction resolvase